jgi:hypothetical protein
MGQIAWGVTSVLLTFVSHRSSAILRVIRLIDFLTQLTDVFYILDPWFPATVFLASVYVSIADLDQEYCCLCPKV